MLLPCAAWRSPIDLKAKTNIFHRMDSAHPPENTIFVQQTHRTIGLLMEQRRAYHSSPGPHSFSEGHRLTENKSASLSVTGTWYMTSSQSQHYSLSRQSLSTHRIWNDSDEVVQMDKIIHFTNIYWLKLNPASCRCSQTAVLCIYDRDRKSEDVYVKPLSHLFWWVVQTGDENETVLESNSHKKTAAEAAAL